MYLLLVNGVYDIVKLQYKTDKKLSLILVLNKYGNDLNPPLLSTNDIQTLDSEKKWHNRKIKLFVPKFKLSPNALSKSN